MWMRAFLLTISAVSVCAADRVPVVVELFTSEGCSSCPPADAVLRRLEESQPVPGVEIIVLGQHVDYWDRLGWPDAFASALFTARQSEYARAFHNGSVYTPQMVVNGAAEVADSEDWPARREIEHAARGARARVELVPAAAGMLGLKVLDLPRVRGGETLDVVLAITESGLASEVRRGENKGRRLVHTGVVRQLTVVGSIDPRKDTGFTADARLNLQADWKRENLKAVLFVQERSGRRILGAASTKL